MENYKKHIDSFIREKAGRNKETPPSYIWDSLDKKLDELNASKPPVSYRWLRYFAIISLILMLGVTAIVKMFGNSDPEKQNIAKGKTQNESSKTAPTNTTQSNTQTANETTQVADVATNTNNTENTTGNTLPQSDKQAQKEQTTNAPSNTVAANKVASNPGRPGDNNAAANTNKKADVYAGNNNDKNTTTKTTRKQNTEPANQADKIAGVNKSKTGKKSKALHTGNTINPTNNYYSSSSNNESGDGLSKQHPTNETSTGNMQLQASPEVNGKEIAANKGNDNNNAVTKPQNEKETVVTKKDAQPQPAVAKKETINATTIQNHHKEMSKPSKRLEEGIKAGYESGFNSSAASKYVVSPYIQYNVSAKVSLLTQPAIKYANLSSKNIGTPQAYYNVNSDGAVTQNGNSVLTTNGIDSTYTTKYTYQETHDSIVKSYVVRGSYLEFELPILFKYYLAKKVSVFGGINLIYNKLTGITENTYTQQDILRSVNFSTTTSYLPTTLPAGLDLPYTGTSLANYKGPIYQVSQAGQFHIGYMVGFSYEYNAGWLFDALLQQSPVKSNVIGGYNVNAPLSAPYCRLSVGYRFHSVHHKEKLFGNGKDTGRGD